MYKAGKESYNTSFSISSLLKTNILKLWISKHSGLIKK